MEPGPPAPPADIAGAGGSGVVAAITLVFERPLLPAQRLVVDRVRSLMLVHRFELHDIGPGGEVVRFIRVADHVRQIDLTFDEARPADLGVRFTVNSKAPADREALVWMSSLCFQYVHYHVARIATVNGNPHHMDWEAQQDPQGPERVRYWVEHGYSLIERMHRSGG